VKKPDDARYRMSFAVGGLHLNESIDVARAHSPAETWEQTLERVIDAGVGSLPKAASRRRALREIIVRVSTLSSAELEFLVRDADRNEQQALLWVATCRAYRFVREFATEVVRERTLSLKRDLPLETFDVLLSAKAEWDERLAAITPTTRAKLRQILFRIMREASIISDDHRILAPNVSRRLRSLLKDQSPQDLDLFPGLARDGGLS
jgi:hypothetical protein